MADGITYGQLQVKHPEYDDLYWRRCRALYAGGKKLLRDHVVMRDVFPPHLQEQPFIYEERKRRAVYIPYPGAIINMIVAELFEEKLSLSSDPDADPWYEEWFKDVSPPGGRTMALNDLLKHQMRTALQLRRAWTLVELPKMPEGALPENLAEEEGMGLLDAYACPVEPESVRDWQITDDGELVWVLLAFESRERNDLTSGREMVREEFVHYTKDSYARYVIEYREDRPPKDTDAVPLMESGPLSFGRVPLAMLELPEGLWAMNLLDSLAVAHFNTRSALTWAMYKSLFPVLHVFEGPTDPLAPMTEDADRAVNQVRGQGHVVRMSSGDRVEFIGPNPAPYGMAAQDIATLRDEMYRVIQHMAQSIDNSGAALQRSAESKTVDQVATAIVLKALGQLVGKHTLEVLDLVGRGRGEVKDGEPLYVWIAKGMDEYQSTSLTSLLEQMQIIDTIGCHSPTAARMLEGKYLKMAIGDDGNEETWGKIEDELERNLPDEMFKKKAETPLIPPKAMKPGEQPGAPGLPQPGPPMPPKPEASA